ncbi:MAG: MFS transporter [Firmicutes bacterium]|nr:MFS transporter [Bacillota bacterium]
MESESKVRKYLAIFALGLAGGSIYCLPYIKYILYDAQIAAMDISNTQSGMLMTMYTIGNMILYIPGGILADKISPKKGIAISLLATTVLGLIYAFIPTYVMGLIVWLGFSFSSAFIFWAALLKAVRLIGTEEQQGWIYGCYYACNGITGALTNAIAMKAYGMAGGDVILGFKYACIAAAIIPAIAAIMLWFLLKDGQGEEERLDSGEGKFNFSDALKLIKNPIVWIVSIVVMIGYGFYTGSSWFTPYLTAVRGVTPEDSAAISIIRNNLLLLLAPVGGLIADKLFHSTTKWLATAFALLAVFYVGAMMLPSSMSGTAAGLYTLLPAIVATMMYGVIWSTMNEAGIPTKLAATAIGIASIIGYLPDSIYNLIFGQFLDKQGDAGYNSIFIFFVVTAIIGIFLALVVGKMGKKNKEQHVLD